MDVGRAAPSAGRTSTQASGACPQPPLRSAPPATHVGIKYFHIRCVKARLPEATQLIGYAGLGEHEKDDLKDVLQRRREEGGPV